MSIEKRKISKVGEWEDLTPFIRMIDADYEPNGIVVMAFNGVCQKQQQLTVIGHSVRGCWKQMKRLIAEGGFKQYFGPYHLVPTDDGPLAFGALVDKKLLD